MRRLAKDGFSSFHQSFRERWMSMNGIGQIASRRPHFDRDDSFGNHFARTRADDANTEHSLLDRLHNDLRDAFCPRDRLGSS